MNPTPERPDSVGYLIVKVSTARGAIPLEGASVTIQGGDTANSGITYSLRTDRDGQTERIALPTPARSISQSPNSTVPYANYNIDVFREGYVPLRFQNVPVFPTVVSIQPAVMVPASAFDTDSAHRNAATVIPESAGNGL
ncbi:MAG: hypothetical protein E7668_05485 [Ruminococcaceae bacterium]|nr:hypothetical protein [Oscillospiraceae bacterium]